MSDFLGGIGDALGDAAGAIGNVAGQAADFLLPEATPGGQDLSLGSAVGSLGGGLQDALREGPLGLIQAGKAAVTGDGLSARDRLFLGGMALVGTGMTARQLHKAYSANRLATHGPFDMDFKGAPAPSEAQMIAVGLKPRFKGATPDAVDFGLHAPTLNGYQHQILGGTTVENVAIGITKGNRDPLIIGKAGGFIDKYTQHIGDFDAAKVDIAKFQLVMDKTGMLKGKAAPGLKKIWKKLESADPNDVMSDEEFSQLAFVMDDISTVTDSILGPDLSFGSVGKLSEIHLGADGTMFLATVHPIDWSSELVRQLTQRKRMLEKINWTDPGVGMHIEANLRHMLGISLEDFDKFQRTGQSRFKDPLNLGPRWYYTSHDDIARTFGVKDTDKMYPSFVAGVSFLSEAQDWETNILKAKTVFDVAQKNHVEDPDFFSWLRDGVKSDDGVKSTYVGVRAKEHQATFQTIIDAAKAEELDAATEDTMKKILRMWGGGESPESVFRSTDATKQKNFYLNLLDPFLQEPVTIDRHAFDAGTGVDFGTTSRPINTSVGDGRVVYDVFAALYRKLAVEYDMTPHEVQAVIWEGWKRFKGSQDFRGGWAKGDPVQLPNMMVDSLHPAPNWFFEVLNGRGDALPVSLRTDQVERIPIGVMEALDVEGITSLALPDGSVGIAMDLDSYSSMVARTQAPFVRGPEGAYRWGPVYARPIESMDAHASELARDPLAQHETFLSTDVARHPLVVPGEAVTFEIPDGVTIGAPRGTGVLEDLGRSVSSRPARSYTRRDPASIPAADWRNPNKTPLNHSAWATISAAMNPDQVAHRLTLDDEFTYSPGRQNAALRNEIIKRGYGLVEAEGRYTNADGVPTVEGSFFVEGITPEDARDIAEMFGQESVLTDQGFIYNRDTGYIATENSSRAGKLDRTSSVKVFRKQPASDYTALKVGDEEIWFSAEGATWDTDQMVDIADINQLVPRGDNNVRKMVLRLRDGQEPATVVELLERKHNVRNVSIYSDRGSLGEGWDRSYESMVTDGNRTRITRSADGPLGDPYGGHVFTRDGSALNPRVAGEPQVTRLGDRVVVNNSVKIAAPEGFATKGVKRWGYLAATNEIVPIADGADSSLFDAVVEGRDLIPGNEADLVPATKAWRAFEEAGYEDTLKVGKSSPKLRMKTSLGRHEFPTAAARNPKQPPLMAKTRNGQEISRLRHDGRVNQQILDELGISVDGGHRLGQHVFDLPPETYTEIGDTLRYFSENNNDALNRWGFNRVVVSPGLPGDADQFAFVEWTKSGAMVLSKEYWKDMPEFVRHLEYARGDLNLLSSRVPPTPAGIVAHEMGHILHGALRLEEGSLNKSASALDDRVIAMIGEDWQGVARREISATASVEVSELVAESVSEVLLAAKPSPVARAVVDMINDELREHLAFKREMRQPAVTPIAARSTTKAAPAPVLEASRTVTDPDNKFWGKGIDVMFPSNSLGTPAPFPSVGKHKKLQAFDKDLVNAAVAAGDTTTIDPRTLHATQPSVTQDGVRHYVEGDGTLYADADQAGNQYPVIYRRDEGGRVRNLILSGTHRAAAALAKGEQLEAIVVDGPWGPPR